VTVDCLVTGFLSVNDAVHISHGLGDLGDLGDLGSLDDLGGLVNDYLRSCHCYRG